jgi:predicted nucleic acid-binding Zn ribbon protein
MEDRFKSTVNSPRRCPRCGRYLVSERDVYCSDECFQIVRKQRLEVLNREEEDVVY